VANLAVKSGAIVPLTNGNHFCVILEDYHREPGVFNEVKTFGVLLYDCPKCLAWIRHWYAVCTM